MSKAALDWDYSDLAEHYRLRAPYAQCALDDLLELVQARADTACVDIGAGSGRLSAMLVAAGLQVTAVEPNPQMRAIGQREVPHACWLAARGEDTGLPDRCCDLVTFGSSFNVMPAQAALATAARLLRPSGWLACIWNHRDLDDPLQARLQAAIQQHVPGYVHGMRREDPTPLIECDDRFDPVRRISSAFVQTSSAHDFVAGFRAHATLVRQAGDAMHRVLAALAGVVADRRMIDVPFTTRIYAARRNERA